MKKFFLGIFIILSGLTFAQNTVISKPTENLIIEWDSELRNLIASKEKENCNTSPDLPPIPKIEEYCMGHRIQVFYSKDRNKAEQKLKEVKSLFPNLHSQIEFISPEYRVKFGFFKTTNDAKKYLDKAKMKFPLSLMVQEKFRCVLAD